MLFMQQDSYINLGNQFQSFIKQKKEKIWNVKYENK